MFGGLRKTSSRIAIAVALGFTLGGYVSTPAKAADLGGDCCADLEERVAELEATTVRKGNKKVSVTLSGWVVKAVNWWDDDVRDDFWVGDKDADLTSRFAITGSATIAPGWSGGYNITVTVPGNFIDSANGTGGNVYGIATNQFGQDSGLLSGINTLYSYMYIKSDTYGTINWGYLSPASDNAAVLADISGTVIESNAPLFEGPGFLLRPSGAPAGFAGYSALTFGSFSTCNSGVANIGFDCYGAPQSGVRYDTPTFGGFRAEFSYTDYLNNLLTRKGAVLNTPAGLGVYNTTPETYDAALIYNGDWWDNWKVSAAYSYTHINASVGTNAPTADNDIHQIGATIMHTPSGLGIYGMYQNDSTDGRVLNEVTGVTQSTPESDNWYLKPFIKRTWNPLGATILYGEYSQMNNQFGGLVGANLCGAGVYVASGALAGTAPVCATAATAGGMYVSGSEFERYGLGAVQEIDAAAMHVFARWQHQDLDVDFRGRNAAGNQTNVNQGFNDWDLFQVGGIIFF